MMRYMIVNNDNTGTYYRQDFEGDVRWQPFAGNATLYSLDEVKAVINFITYLNAGESLKIVAVWLDND